jgi:hypothetical protein
MKPASPPEFDTVADELKRLPVPPQSALKALAALQEAADADAPPPLSPDELPPLPEDLIARLEEEFAPQVEPAKPKTSSQRVSAAQSWWQRLFSPQFGLAFATLLILGVVAVMVQHDDKPVLRGSDKPAAARDATILFIGNATDLTAFTKSWDGAAPVLAENAAQAVLLAKQSKARVVIIADSTARTITVQRDGQAAAPKPVEQVLPDQAIENLVLGVQNELDALAP